MVSRPAVHDISGVVEEAFPGWRAWRRPDGGLAARKGGSPISGALACGATPGELMRAIKAICAPPRLQPAESTVLIVLRDSSEPLPVEQICAAGGIARP